jgi:hypothetical protein
MKKSKFIVTISIAAFLVFNLFFGKYFLFAGFLIYEFFDVEYTNIDGSNMTFVQDYNGSSGSSWEYELIPEGKIELTGEDRRVVFFSPAGEDILHFKAVEPGEFTMVWFSYNSGFDLDVKESYAQDYRVSDDLQIEKVGKIYPILMIKDSKTISESMERTRSYIQKLLNEESDYSDAEFTVTYDTSLRKIYVSINRFYNEKELKIYTHNFVLEQIKYEGLFYKYSVTVSVEKPVIKKQETEE